MRKLRNIGLIAITVTAQANAQMQTSVSESGQWAMAEAEVAQTVDSIAVDGPAAASDPATDAAPRSRNVLIDEVVVTAQKREQNIQDVPIAIKAFSADQLAVLGIEDTKSLGTITPGLQFSEMLGFTLIYLRGVGTDSFLPYSDPSVATYIDGLYVPAMQGLINSFPGVERVEVLKGPQGTLFGRNSTGGAISVVTKAPDKNTEVSLSGEVGNLGARKASVFASFPVLDSVAISVAGVYSHTDAYYELDQSNLGPLESPPDGPILDEESKGGRLKLRWWPTDDLDLVLTAYHMEQEGSGSLVMALKHPSLLATLLGIQAESEKYKVHRNETSRMHVVSDTLSANLTWALPWFDVRFIGGHQRIETRDARAEYDFSPKDLVSFGTKNAYQEAKTAELQIASNSTSWRSDQLTWVGGLYWFDGLGGYDPITFGVLGGELPSILPGASLISADVLPLVLDRLAFLSAIPGLTTQPGVGVDIDIYGVLETESRSVFLQGTYNPVDWLGITLGGRYQEESRFLSKQTVALPSNDGGTTLIPWGQPKVSQSNFSPKVSFDVRPANDVLMYLSYTRGYKSGTYNGIGIYTSPSYVEPEEVDAYELGIKSTFFGGNLRVNAALFQSETKNLQVTFVSLTAGGAIQFENAGESRTRGAEADIMWVPMPDLNPGLVMTTGASFLDSVFTDYTSASGYDVDTGIYFGGGALPLVDGGTLPGRDFTGNRIPRTPRWSGNFALNQMLDTRWGPFELGADVYYNGGFYYTAQNTELSKQDAYRLINARASWTYEPWNLKATAFVQNIDSEEYSYAAFTADFGVAYSLAPPRMYGIRLNWKF